jgi:hypothetical protein
VSDGKSKALGGAAVGAGGIIALIFKAGAGDVAEVGVRAASVGGREAVHVGAAGAGAGGARALARGGAGAAMVGELAGPASRAALPSVEAAPLRVATVSAKAPTIAPKLRGERIRAVLEHSESAVDVLDVLVNVGDLASSFGDDEDDLEARFSAAGVDFRSEVVAGVRGDPVPSLVGASRAVYTDGNVIHPGIRLSPEVASRRLSLEERSSLSVEKRFGAGADKILYAAPLADPNLENVRGARLLTVLATSPDIEWSAVSVPPLPKAPRVIEKEGVRYAMLMDERTPPAAATQLILIGPNRR